MKGKLFAGVLVVAVVVVGAYFLRRGGSEDKSEVTVSPEVSSAAEMTAAMSPVATSSPAESSAQGPVKTFQVHGGMFYFNPKEIKVNKGDTVKIVFTNDEGFHDWVIDEFNARTPQIQGGQTATVQFVADKTGTFEYYCSVGTHRQKGMKGNLIVQ